jgi:glycosyltransferase involved in cell wall biosynthesis
LTEAENKSLTPNSSPQERGTLVILIPGFPSSEADTTCLPLQQSFVRNLKQLYPQLNIIILSFQYPFYKKTYKLVGATIMAFNGQNKGGISRLLLRRKINEELNEIRNKNNVIGILSFWYGECALVGHRFGMKHHIKHFCWLMGQDARKKNKYPKRVAANGDELIALSDFLQNEFENNHGARPQQVIPSGIDIQQFQQHADEKAIDILGAGSLITLKQYDRFIEIVVEIKKTFPAVKAMLVGNGPEKEKLKLLVTKYGLTANLILTGELPHDEVLLLMRRAKVFLHTSSYEGFSGVCLEALAGGAHVISFCRAMNQEIEHWHIVKDDAEMKQKAISILQNEQSYNPVFPFLITDTVKAIAGLFSIEP